MFENLFLCEDKPPIYFLLFYFPPKHKKIGVIEIKTTRPLCGQNFQDDYKSNEIWRLFKKWNIKYLPFTKISNYSINKKYFHVYILYRIASYLISYIFHWYFSLRTSSSVWRIWSILIIITISRYLSYFIISV